MNILPHCCAFGPRQILSRRLPAHRPLHGMSELCQYQAHSQSFGLFVRGITRITSLHGVIQKVVCIRHCVGLVVYRAAERANKRVFQVAVSSREGGFIYLTPGSEGPDRLPTEFKRPVTDDELQSTEVLFSAPVEPRTTQPTQIKDVTFSANTLVTLCLTEVGLTSHTHLASVVLYALRETHVLFVG